jgi:hypothetical protein
MLTYCHSVVYFENKITRNQVLIKPGFSREFPTSSVRNLVRQAQDRKSG